MRGLALAAAAAVLAAAPWAAAACDDGRIVACSDGNYCALEGAEGWVSYRPVKPGALLPNVPAEDRAVLVLTEVIGTFGDQRIYTLGRFKDCQWSFKNTFVRQNPYKILSWKRRDEPLED